MADNTEEKLSAAVSEAFLEYEEEMVKYPAYAGMPDLRYPDGHIQWEAPSNRTGGAFRDSHDKRLHWWEEKARSLDISTTEDKWISKVAKRIHPTGVRPCKVCGRLMEIRYAYLGARFISRVNKLSFFDPTDMELTETTHILDFVASFVDLYGQQAFRVLPALLKAKAAPHPPSLPDTLDSWIQWLDEVYIPSEPKPILGPGAMSNAPDRLDGFHTYNRCCRPTADTGRSKKNLASYSRDRRAFENWSDGNWILANLLMGLIKSDTHIRQELCANYGDGHRHTRPCDADHIGPISLGFCHRPEFQLLCSSCNSAKNNRLYFSDVQHLIAIESEGTQVATWYAQPVWDRCKGKVTDKDTALKLSRIMRDNRNIALMLLYDFMSRGECLFLLSLLHLEYADYSYKICPGSVQVNNHIVTAKFSQQESTLKYVNTQKRRKIRVAFEALVDYATKENRNGYRYTDSSIERLKNQAFDILGTVSHEIKALSQLLLDIVSSETPTDHDIDVFLDKLNCIDLDSVEQFVEAKTILHQIMKVVSAFLAGRWDDPRYSRD